MINHNSKSKKAVYFSAFLLIILLTVVSISGVSVAEDTNNYDDAQFTYDFLLSTITDGYLYDANEGPERDGMRVVDFRIASTEIPANSTVESEIIIANYGAERLDDIRLEPYITDSVTEDRLDSEEYTVEPRSYYENITLEPGEHKVYTFEFEFDEEAENSYDISFINTNAPESRHMATNRINVNNEFSGAEDTFILNRERLTKDKISITRYKDENVFRSSNPGASSSLPPVEKDSEGNIIDSDVAIGSVSDFGNIRSDSNIYGSIISSTGEIDVGFSAESVSNSNHYAISLLYELEDIDSVELNVVTSTGDEIDEDSSYYLSSESSDKTERVFQLTEKEIEYIQSQREVYFTYDNVDTSQNDIEMKLYEMRVIALNNVWNIPEPELSADLNASINDEEITEAQIGERIEITANISNDASTSVHEQFRLRELALSDGSTVDISDKVIINPGDTREVTFRFTVSESGEHEFNLLGESIMIDVGEAGEGTLRQSISTNTSVIGVGGEIEFRTGNLAPEDLDRIDNFEWRFNNEDGYTNRDEDVVVKQYTEAGSYSVTLKTEYENSDGEIETHTTQTVIDVIEGPEPIIDATQYKFTVDDQDVNGEVIGSEATGQMRSGTCANYCGGAFSFDGIGLAISQGINMLVLEVDRDGHQYNPIFYGTYDVVDDEFATTNSVTSDGMDSIRNAMSNGGTSGASQNLVNDINELKGEDRYFMFVGGGNPAPTQNSASVFNTLEDIGADLNGEETKELEENSMWTFTTQTLSNGDSTPLQETYVPESSNLPSISHDYSLSPVRIADEGNAIPNRPIHYDLEQMQIVSSISDSVIIWTMDDESVIEGELYTSEIYTTDGTEHAVSVYAEDDLGLDGSVEREIQTNSINPVASIPDNMSPAVDEESLLYTLNSYDEDSTIENYTWILPELGEEGTIVDGEDVIYNERNPEHTWDYAGVYDVTLQVEDRYGNTNTTTEQVQILGSPPQADADIRRVTSNFMPSDRFDINSVVSDKPVIYYPLEFADGKTQEYAHTLEGTVTGSLNQISGVSSDNYALEFDGSSQINVPETANNPISEQFGISVWVKTREDGTIYSATDGESADAINLRISESNPDFEVISDGEGTGLNFNSDLKDDEWNHVVASYDIVEGMKLYVNGELDNTNTRDVGPLNIDSKPTTIGADARGNAGAGYFTGGISDVQLYNMRLDDSDSADLYNNNANPLVDVSYQGVFYEFGESYNPLSQSTQSYGSGTVEEQSNYYNIVADSYASGEDSEQYLEIENIDYSQYNTIYMTYDAEFYRELTQGVDITGVISMKSDNENSEHVVYNDMNVYKNGIMEFDVSNIEDTGSLYIHAQSFGSNLGQTDLEVYELWGETESTVNYPSRTDFYNSVFPDIAENTNIHETRNGIRIAQKDISAQQDITSVGESGVQHNIIPVGDATSIDIIHNIRTSMLANEGLNLYADNSGSYTLGSGAANPESILCESSALLNTNCAGTGTSPDESTVQGSSYSHVGLETGILQGSAVIESLVVNAETDSSMYPTVHFDGSASSGSGAGIYIKEYEWDLSPDTSFNADYVGETFTHTFDELGEHDVALRTTDTFGETSTEVFTFEVSNLEPEIQTQFTTIADLGSNTSFGVTAESPGEADIEQIIWDMGDGNYVEGNEVSYEYTTGGEYDVTVIVIDEAGLTTSETNTVYVGGEDPDLDGITTSSRVHIMDTVLFDTSGDGFDSFDTDEHPISVRNTIDLSPAEDPNGGELTFNWDFPSQTLFNVDNPYMIVDDFDSQTVTVTAQNDERRTASEDIDIEVYNDGPILHLDIGTPEDIDDEGIDGLTFASVPVEVTVNAYHFHQRIGGEITVDMGDGNVYTHTVPEDVPTNYEYTFEHLFDVNPNDYDKEDFIVTFDVDAQIEDDFGAIAEESKSINVEHRGVEITNFEYYNEDGIQEDEVEAGEPITYEVNATAPDVQDGDLEYKFDFSSGDTSGWQSSNTYEQQWTVVGAQTADVTVREVDYGFADTDSVETYVRVRESCRRIQENNEDPESGLYYVVPDGFDTPVQVLCDMDYDDGGWTLVLAANARDDGYGYNDGPANDAWETPNQYSTPNAEFGTLNQRNAGDGWKLSDAMIRQIQVDGEGVIRATTLDLEQFDNERNGQPVRRFFNASAYQHDVNVVNRGTDLTTSYESPAFENVVQSQNPPSGWRLQGIADGHYDEVGTGYATVHCHNPCFVDADTAIWVR